MCNLAPPNQGITAENSNQKRSSFAASEHRARAHRLPQYTAWAMAALYDNVLRDGLNDAFSDAYSG
jgi:hypothetical protein